MLHRWARARSSNRSPPKKKSGEIEEAILSAAKDLFLDVGDEATSMEAVAQAAGVSKRTLYARHSTKEALMEAVLEDRVQRWSNEANARGFATGGREAFVPEGALLNVGWRFYQGDIVAPPRKEQSASYVAANASGARGARRSATKWCGAR